jgi:hypothetical protein
MSNLKALTVDWQPAAAALDLIAQAQQSGLTVRLLGSVAVRLRFEATGMTMFTDKRTYKDADLVCSNTDYNSVRQLVLSLGFESDRELEVATEGKRLLFRSYGHPFSFDLFVDELDFCHRLEVHDRISIDPLTLPIADLLLSKLQRVDLRPADRQDVAVLLAAFPLGDSDGDQINVMRITSLLSVDWGFCRTVLTNLQEPEPYFDHEWLEPAAIERVTTSLAELRKAIVAAPKTWRWKLRNLAGERISWYHTVDSTDIF